MVQPFAETEKILRKTVAKQWYPAPLREVSRHHSIGVMDREVAVFTNALPSASLILDVGGCWGWHWRNIAALPKNIRIILLDFVPENFIHAARILGDSFQREVVPMAGDARQLPFPPNTFDAVWTVQTLQHIPEFEKACREAWRVLKPGGRFINYSLHSPLFVRLVYLLFGKKFHQKGEVEKCFYLRRADEEQKHVLEKIFQGPVREKFTECIFHPDLHLTHSGREGSPWGRVDFFLGKIHWISRFVARQRSFEVIKCHA